MQLLGIFFISLGISLMRLKIVNISNYLPFVPWMSLSPVSCLSITKGLNIFDDIFD